MAQDKRKIMIISGVSSIDGGSNAALVENVLNLKNQFEFLIIIPNKGTLSERLEQKGINYEIVKGVLWRHSVFERESFKRKAKKVFINLVADWRLFKIIKKEKIDLVHINVSAIGIGWLAAKLSKKPIMWHLRELNDIDQNYPLDYPKVAAFMFNRSTLIPISTFVFNYYKHFLNNSRQLYLIKDGIRVDELSKIANLAKGNKDLFTIGFLGGYQPHKGLRTILESVSILKSKYPTLNVRLEVYGSQYQQNIHIYQALANQFGIENVVHFHGFSSNLVETLSSLDVVISGGLEAFGRVVAETIVSGRICLGSDEGATPELIDNGKNGFIFKHQNAEDLSEKIVKIIENWSDLTDFIEKNRDNAIKRFSSEETANEIAVLYEKLIRSSKDNG